jgi:C-terminal processing protease CtpA/Prc
MNRSSFVLVLTGMLAACSPGVDDATGGGASHLTDTKSVSSTGYVLTNVRKVALEDEGASGEEGAAIDIRTAPDPLPANYQWTLTPSADGSSFTIVNSASGKCLDDASSMTNGIGVTQSSCSGAASQKWRIREWKAPTPFSGPGNVPDDALGIYDIVSEDNGRCLDIHDGVEPIEGRQAVTWDCWDGDTQHWYITRGRPETSGGVSAERLAQAQAASDYAQTMIANTAWPLVLDLASVQSAVRNTILLGDGSDATYYRALWNVLLSVPEGHQGLSNGACDTPEMFYQAATRLDVCGRPYGNDLIVTGAAPGNPLGLSAGDRITAAGSDRGPALLEAAARRPVCGDSAPSDSGRRNWAAASFFGTVPAGMVLTIVPADGTAERTVTVPNESLPLASCSDPMNRDVRFNAKATVRPDGVAVIQLPRLSPIDGNLPKYPTEAEYQQFSDAFQASIQAEFDKVKNAPAIVWDVRGNGGGITQVGLNIVSGMPGARATTLSSCTSRIAGSAPPAFSAEQFAAYSIVPGGPFAYAGKVAVIIDGGDYSAADYFAYAVAQATDVPLVGAATSGAFGSSADPFDIAATPKVQGWFDKDHCVDANGVTLDGHGVVPTHPVDYEPADLRAGVDTVLEAAVRLVK